MKTKFANGDKVKSQTKLPLVIPAAMLQPGKVLRIKTEADLIGVVQDRNAFGDYLIAWPDGSTHWVKSRHLLRAR